MTNAYSRYLETPIEELRDMLIEHYKKQVAHLESTIAALADIPTLRIQYEKELENAKSNLAYLEEKATMEPVK